MENRENRENRESLVAGAAREAFEEATARSDDLRLFGVYSLPRISQVYVMFQGTLRDGYACANEETLEVRLFDEADIPWQDIAFPIMTEALERWYEQHPSHVTTVHCADIASAPGVVPLDITRHTPESK